MQADTDISLSSLFIIDNSFCGFRKKHSGLFCVLLKHKVLLETHSAAISFVKCVGVIITSCRTKSTARHGQQSKIACYIPAVSS